MNLKELFKTLLQCNDDINIQYTNIDGKEKLLVNGIEISEGEDQTFDDSGIKTEVIKFKEDLKQVDDNLFVVFCEQLSKILDINEFNKLLDLKSFNEEQAVYTKGLINQSKTVLYELIDSRIDQLVNLKSILK